MLIIPAIDIKDKQCVRLCQGRMAEVEIFSEDPVAIALRWQQEGAQLLHVVDLDGAFLGRPVNLPVIEYHQGISRFGSLQSSTGYFLITTGAGKN